MSSCPSCCDLSSERYLIQTTTNFKILLDSRCQVPGKYLIVSLAHLHPTNIVNQKHLFEEIELIKMRMEITIRRAFGSGSTVDRGIRFNYCRLGNSFHNPQDEHYHEFCTPVSSIPLECVIRGIGYRFENILYGKPFDNTVRNNPHPIVLEWILSEIKKKYEPEPENLDLLNTEQKNLELKECDCISCTNIKYESAPLIETEHFKVVLNDKNQYCFGRIFIVCQYHIDMSKIRYYRPIMNEFYVILQYVENLIYKFYDDSDRKTTRIHVCQLGNMSGKIGNTHSFWHIIPRTSKKITIQTKDRLIEFEDIYWGTSFNNNVKYHTSPDLLDYVRSKMIQLISTTMKPPIKFNIVEPIKKSESSIDCLQCKSAETDIEVSLFKTNNFRVILRRDDQRVPGRSLIIALDHIHPDKFRQSLHLIIEQSIVETLLHQTFVVCYGYQRCQILKLGNLTKSAQTEHHHMHYIPSGPDDIVIKFTDKPNIVIQDTRWGVATNINPAEGYVKVFRPMEVITKIKEDFRNNFVGLDKIRDQLRDILNQKNIDPTIAENLDFMIDNIILGLNIVFL